MTATTRNTTDTSHHYTSERRKVAGDNGGGDDDNVPMEEHKDTRLGSLVLPWAMMVLVSVVAAVMLYPKEGTSDWDDEESSWTSSNGQQQVFLQRLLDGNSREELHREHVHKHVFEEQHKPLLPLDTSDQIGFVFAVMGLMVAAGGGIGGGGILVPIYILIMGFTPKHAIPLSNITVLGGALANMILNVTKRHPIVDRPLVDWDLILVMEVSGNGIFHTCEYYY